MLDERLNELGTTLTIYGYSLNGIRDEDPDYKYYSSKDFSGFYDEDEKTLHLLVTGECTGDIGVIKFYVDEDLEDSIFSVNVENYLSGGRNDITIKLPQTVQANLVVPGGKHELEGFGKNPGCSIFKDYTEDKEISRKSFENYIESETTNFDNPRYQVIDDSGREVSGIRTYRVYNNLKISCQDLVYGTKFGLSYYGGEIQIFGTADYIEYQDLDGYIVEKSSGIEEIESIPGIELITTGFLNNSRDFVVSYPEYQGLNISYVYARLGDLVSERIGFTYAKTDPSFQVLQESTELGEYYHDFGVVPVYLFEHTQGSTNSFTIKVNDFSRDQIRVENLNTELFDYQVESVDNQYTVTLKTLKENTSTLTWQPQELEITSMYFGEYIYRFGLIQKADLSSLDLYDSSAGVKYEGEILVPYLETSTEIRPIPEDENERDTWFVTEFEDTGNRYEKIKVDPRSGKFGNSIILDTNSYVPNTVWKKKLGRIRVGRACDIGVDYWKFYADLAEKEYDIVKAGIEPEFELITNYTYNQEPGLNRVIDDSRIVLDAINVYGFTVRSNCPFVCYVQGSSIDLLVNNEHTNVFYSSNHDNVEGINIFVAERKNESTKSYHTLGKIKFGIPKKESFILPEDYQYDSSDFLYEKEYKVVTGREPVSPQVEYVDKNYIFVDDDTDGLIEFTSKKTPKYDVFDILGDQNTINSVVLVEQQQQEEQRGSDSTNIISTVLDYQNIQDLGDLILGNIEDVMYNDHRRYVKHQQLVTSTFDSTQKHYYPSDIRSIIRESSQGEFKDFYVFCKKLPPKVIWNTGFDFDNIAFIGIGSTSITLTFLSRYLIKKSDIKFVDVNKIYTSQYIVDQQEQAIEENVNLRNEPTIPKPEQNQLQLVIDYENYYSDLNDYRYKYTITVNLNSEDTNPGYIGMLRIKSRIYSDSIVNLEKRGKYTSLIPRELEIEQLDIDNNIEKPDILDVGIYRGYPNQIDVFPHGSGEGYEFNVPASGINKQFQAVPGSKVGLIGGDAITSEGGSPGRFILNVPSRVENYKPLSSGYSDYYEPKTITRFVGINNKFIGSDIIETRGSQSNQQPGTSVQVSYDNNFDFRFIQPGIENGLFVSKNTSPVLYLGDRNEPLEIEVSAGTDRLRLFAGVLPLNEDFENTGSDILPNLETDIEYSWILNNNNEYTTNQLNLELRFPINLTSTNIEMPCTFSYTDSNSGITHKIKIIIKQLKYSSLVVCPSEVYFSSSGLYIGKDSSDIIYRFEYMYQDISDLTLEVAGGTILLEEPIAIIPNYRIQANTPGFYVYDAMIRLKPNYTDNFLDSDDNYLMFMRNNEAISDKIVVKQGYRCCKLSLGDNPEYIYSKRVFGSFNNPVASFSGSHGTIKFTARQERREYRYINDTWEKGAIDKSFDQLIYVSSTYKYSTSGEVLQEQDILNYTSLSSYLNSGTGYDRDPYARITYDFDVIDPESEFYIVSELSIKGYFRDGSEPISTYKIYIKKVSPDTIYTDYDYMCLTSSGYPVKTYKFESYYDNGLDIEFSGERRDINPEIELIGSNNDRYIYKINVKLPDNRSDSIYTGALNIIKDGEILKSIQVKQGYRYAYIENPCTKEKVLSGEESEVNILKTGELKFIIKQVRAELDSLGTITETVDYSTESGTVTIVNMDSSNYTYNSLQGEVFWKFTNLDRSRLGKISFSRTYKDLSYIDYYEFTFRITIRSYDFFIKIDDSHSYYTYIDDPAKLDVSSDGIVSCTFGLYGFNSLNYKVSLPFKLKIRQNLIGPKVIGGSYSMCKINPGETLTQEDKDEGCVVSKKLDIEFEKILDYTEGPVTGSILIYLSNGTSKFAILDIRTIQRLKYYY